jgi:hypothetical protein
MFEKAWKELLLEKPASESDAYNALQKVFRDILLE